MIEIADIVGYCAATLTTLCFIPQVLKVAKSRDTKAISLPMYVFFSLGVALWFVYGVMIESIPIIIANIVTLSLSLTIIFMKIKHK